MKTNEEVLKEIESEIAEVTFNVLTKFPGAVRPNGKMATLKRRHQRRFAERLRKAILKHLEDWDKKNNPPEMMELILNRYPYALQDTLK